MLDRIVRGRVWIPLLGVLLAGIVAMQVEVLKLGASMGLSIQRGTALQSRNEILRASVASLTDETRIEQRAAAMGMVMALPGEAGFLTVGGRADVQRAIDNIHTPDTTAFTAALQATELALGATAPAAVTTTTSPGGAVSGSSAVTPTATVPPAANGGQTNPATATGTTGTTGTTGNPATSSDSVAPTQTAAPPPPGAGSTSAATGVPTQTGASAPPAGTGVPTAGQTDSSGGAAPTGG